MKSAFSMQSIFTLTLLIPTLVIAGKPKFGLDIEAGIAATGMKGSLKDSIKSAGYPPAVGRTVPNANIHIFIEPFRHLQISSGIGLMKKGYSSKSSVEGSGVSNEFERSITALNFPFEIKAKTAGKELDFMFGIGIYLNRTILDKGIATRTEGSLVSPGSTMAQGRVDYMDGFTLTENGASRKVEYDEIYNKFQYGYFWSIGFLRYTERIPWGMNFKYGFGESGFLVDNLQPLNARFYNSSFNLIFQFGNQR